MEKITDDTRDKKPYYKQITHNGFDSLHLNTILVLGILPPTSAIIILVLGSLHPTSARLFACSSFLPKPLTTSFRQMLWNLSSSKYLVHKHCTVYTVLVVRKIMSCTVQCTLLYFKMYFTVQYKHFECQCTFVHSLYIVQALWKNIICIIPSCWKTISKYN